MAEPNFENLLKVLRREVPDRPTLFEFFLNDTLYERLAGPIPDDGRPWAGERRLIAAFAAAGYDYATIPGSDFWFPRGERDRRDTVSLSEGGLITDRASFEAYRWPDPDRPNYSRLTALAEDLPAGMKIITQGPCGVLENVIQIVGYETICFILADDPALARDIFDAVGSRLVRYYEICASYETVGALIGNDDWGFKTQPMLSPADMRRYVIPWHKRIVEAIHAAGKPAILHSCGNLASLTDDIIDDIGYDGKHSYEDIIEPVEDAYERLNGRIAVLGGIDLDFICRSTPEQVRRRSEAMLERAAGRGGYALGTGNSVPEYVPQENYLAMIAAATAGRH